MLAAWAQHWDRAEGRVQALCSLECVCERQRTSGPLHLRRGKGEKLLGEPDH